MIWWIREYTWKMEIMGVIVIHHFYHNTWYGIRRIYEVKFHAIKMTVFYCVEHIKCLVQNVKPEIQLQNYFYSRGRNAWIIIFLDKIFYNIWWKWYIHSFHNIFLKILNLFTFLNWQGFVNWCTYMNSMYYQKDFL